MFEFDEQCDACKDQSKFPVGFWDGMGEHGEETHGFIFDCHAEDCPIKQKRKEAKARCAKEKDESIRINRENDIDVSAIRQMRVSHRVSLRRAAQILSVSPVECSAWENERKPFPAKEYARLTAYLTNQKQCENCRNYLGGTYGFCGANSEKECGESEKHELWIKREGV